MLRYFVGEPHADPDCKALGEEDRAALRAAGLSNEDIFDLAETAAFYNMSNRMASATDMIPNPEYHKANR